MKEVRRWIKYSYVLWCPVTAIAFSSNPVLATVGPRSLNLLFFFWFGGRATGTPHLVCYREHRQSPSTHTYSLCVWACLRVGVGVGAPSMLFFPKRQPLSLHLPSSPDGSQRLKRKGRRGLWETAPQADEAAGVLLTVCVWPLIEYLVVIPGGTLI